MRASWVIALAVLGGCASAEVAGDGGDDDPVVDASRADGAAIDAVPPDAPIADAALHDAAVEARSFTDDSAADFTAATGALADAVVEPWGAVAPVAYYTGGLLHRASDTGYFTDGSTATWDQVMGFARTARTAISWQTAAGWAADTPPSVGLTSPDDFTQWYEGEVWLDAGSWTFFLLVDDHGFVELAAPGTTTFLRVASANWAVEGSGVFAANVSGWHPIRYAIAEQGGDAQVQLRYAGPGVAPAQAIPRHRLRARTDALVGLVQAGFDSAGGAGDVETTIDAITPGNTDWGAGNPGDLGMTAADTFTVRWTGQLRIDVGGAFTFRYATDDGQRLWVDGVKLIDLFDDATHSTVTSAVELAPGWHDLVIEQSEAGGGAAAFLSVETGPELAGQTLPLTRQRPVEGRADRITSGVNRTDLAIADLATVESAVTVRAPAGALVTSVDVGIGFTHSYKGDLTFSLRAPNGTQVQIVDYAGDLAGAPWSEHFTVSGFGATPVDGTWTLVAQDTLGSDTGTLLDFEVTPHYAGGEPPIPLVASFDSTVRDLGASVVSIDTVTWAERVPAGADIAVRFRTCAAAAECAAAAWSAPLTTSGGTPAVTAQQFLQYRIELTSDGDRAPALESLRVDYQVEI